MAYRSADEVYSLVVNSSFAGKLAPLVEELRTAGAFSNVLAGLLDKLQSDEEFRGRVRGNEVFKIGHLYGLPPYEILALTVAATLLAPGVDWPKVPLTATVAPKAADLAQKYRSQTSDFSTIRREHCDPMLQMILQSRKDAEQIANDPCLCLGTADYNRAEFVFLYLIAALTVMISTKGRSLGIASDFLTASHLSAAEAQRIADSLWQIVKNYKPR